MNTMDFIVHLINSKSSVPKSWNSRTDDVMLVKNYYFSNENKYDVLENVKIVRSNLTSFNFNSIVLK